MFDEFQKFLPKAAAHYNVSKEIKAAQVCQEFRSLSKTLLPNATREQTFVRSYDGKTMTVGALNSAAAQQLAMRQHQILEAINQKFGPKTLQKIKVQISEQTAEAQPDA